MRNFSPGWNISPGTKYEIAREGSQENQNGTKNTNCENRGIASLAVWPFGSAQFSAFWDGNSLQDEWNWSETCVLAADLSARKTDMYLQRKRRYLQARRVHGFPNSLVLFNLICIEVGVLTLYLIFEIRETMKPIFYFIALIPLKSLLLPSSSHIPLFSPGWNSVSITWDFFWFSGPFARAENPSPVWANRARIFSPGWIAPPGLNPSPCNRQFDFKRICFRSRAEVSNWLTGLKFQPGLKFAM